jgi:hypothetical protein
MAVAVQSGESAPVTSDDDPRKYSVQHEGNAIAWGDNIASTKLLGHCAASDAATASMKRPF